MAQKNRTKEIWLIPKRVNLHQTVCLIDGIKERGYDGKSWNESKQNNLGVNLKKWGATRSGKNISSQAIRTLVASIPQYLGFLYINTETTPSTICLTEVGQKLWEKHRTDLVKVEKLVSRHNELITESDLVLLQMEKLQITNPIINKDCENIYVFPFRFMLKVLLKLKYLDQEEIAYFLFKARSNDEIDLVVNEIINFRNLKPIERKKMIDIFKDTHIGNITLVKAPSSVYYMSLCEITGIIEKYSIKPENKESKISAIRIKDEYETYITEMLNSKYILSEAYDFKNDLRLWIDYFGDINRLYPPIDIEIFNGSEEDYLILIKKDGRMKYGNLIESNCSVLYPAFTNEEYIIQFISSEDGSLVCEQKIVPSFNQREFTIVSGQKGSVTKKVKSLENISENILEHCSEKYFNKKTMEYLKILANITGDDKTRNSSLRGAFLESYFYEMLTILKNENIIDDVIWNGKKGDYGLPVQAPGGKTGTPDICFIIENNHYVLELTTIKPKSTQFSAEGSSVPDHIRLYKEENKGKEVIGIFSAPIIHERNVHSMQSTANSNGIVLISLAIDKLLEILLTKDRIKIENRLKELCECQIRELS